MGRPRSAAVAEGGDPDRRALVVQQAPAAAVAGAAVVAGEPRCDWQLVTFGMVNCLESARIGGQYVVHKT